MRVDGKEPTGPLTRVESGRLIGELNEDGNGSIVVSCFSCFLCYLGVRHRWSTLLVDPGLRFVVARVEELNSFAKTSQNPPSRAKVR
jgi:hypothetical protein